LFFTKRLILFEIVWKVYWKIKKLANKLVDIREFNNCEINVRFLHGQWLLWKTSPHSHDRPRTPIKTFIKIQITKPVKPRKMNNTIFLFTCITHTSFITGMNKMLPKLKSEPHLNFFFLKLKRKRKRTHSKS
jgi:hypothetical protein